MKILVVGSGAREHAIAEVFHRSSHQPQVIVTPGNAGIAREFETEDLESFEDIEDYCIIEGINLVFIGPEKPLAEGLADHLRKSNIPVIGPSQAAARIESSKSFAKQLMSKYDIPTAKYEIYNDAAFAIEVLDNWNFPLVLKADGLAGGKGVFIVQDRDEANKVIVNLMQNKALGEAGSKVIIEEYLQGWEVSLFAVTDGEHYRTTIFAQDHKQLYDNDEGPNTGGMGVFAPVPEAEIYRAEIEKKIVEPTLRALREEGCPFEGFLYLGLMITAEGPQVIEYNCRLGDPEAQTILPLLETDFTDVCYAVLQHKVNELQLKWANKNAICVYAVGKEYPYGISRGEVINFSAHMDSHIYYGGVALRGDELVTQGGRILALTAVGLSQAEARTKVYHDLNKVFFEGMHYRKDIGLRTNKI
ncbi:MAG: phosphoribosylamine--glycine ligase [Candidatus Cloacimonadaceae bacterium]